MDVMEMVAQLMAAAALTAPKTRGLDYVRVKVVAGPGQRELAEAMAAYPATARTAYFADNARKVREAGAVVLLGLAASPPNGLDCGACGFPDCKTMAQQAKVGGQFNGPVCAFRLLDLGIALGSAVKTASLHNIDNRIMYSVGMVARHMGLVDWEVAMGIPLSVSSKNIFFAPA